MSENLNENACYGKKFLKKDIKNTAGKCAIILLILSVLTYFLGSLIIRILKIRSSLLGINSTTGMILGLSNDAYNFWVGYFPCIAGDVVAIIACFFIFRKGIKNYISFKKEVPSDFIVSGAFASIGVGIISSIIFLIYSIIINSHGIEIPSPDFSIPKETIYLILFFSYTCIIAPVFEEIIFRGYILNNMRKYGNFTAIIVTSIFFAMFHFNLVQLVNPILMGIILAFVAVKSESIVPSIIVHMFNNIMAMITTLISTTNSQNILLIWSSIYYICGVSALLYFLFKYGKELIDTCKEKNEVLKVRNKIFYSFTNKWSLMYLVFYLFIILVTMVAKNS
ncbi:MAG: CPBP family intramembrane glutamic endopeptidase [Clostridium butyricum]|nr:CPBP family intramembrane glutamic endopeptidase [Clostridium butyricum]